MDKKPMIRRVAGQGVEASDEEKPGNPLLVVHRRLRDKYWYVIPVGLVLGVSAAFAAHKMIPDKYESIGVLEITPTSQRVLYATEQNQPVPMFDAWVGAQIGQIQSPRVIELALKQSRWEEHGEDLARSDFLENLVIFRSKGSLLIQITYAANSPKVSQAAVQSVIEAYRQVHIEQSDRGQIGTMEALRGVLSEMDLERQGLRNRIAEVAGPLSPSAMEGLYTAKFDRQIELESMLLTVRMELAAVESAAGGSGDTAPEAGGAEPIQMLTASELARLDDVLGRLMAAHAAQTLSLEGLIDRFGENHQEVINVRRDLDILDNRIAKRTDELNLLIAQNHEGSGDAANPAIPSNNSLRRHSADALQARIVSLTELRDEVKQQAASLNSDITRIGEFQEQLAIFKRRADDAEARLATLQIEQDRSGRVSIVNEGDLPTTPSNAKKRLQMTGAAGVAGFGLPFGIAFLVGLLRARLNYFDDAKANWGGGAFLGILPELPGDMADPHQALVASLSVHEIRSLLQGVSEKHGAKRFMVTSATAGAGKTSLTLALGLSYAGAGNKTLLIDFDTIAGELSARVRRIIRSRLGKMLIEQGLLEESDLLHAVEIAERDGRKLGETLVDLGHISDGQLSEVLNRQTNSSHGLREAIVSGDLEACVAETGAPNLYYLPVGETSVGDVGTFAKKDIHAMLVQAHEQYDTVLIDTGPILGSLEAAMLAKEADATILVLAAGEQERLVNQAIDRLQRNGAVLAGLVFNRAQQRDVVRFSSSASQQSRMSRRDADAPLIQPRDNDDLPREYGPIAHATAAYQPQPEGEAAGSSE